MVGRDNLPRFGGERGRIRKLDLIPLSDDPKNIRVLGQVVPPIQMVL
jgi:hypothetical protein